MVRTLRARRTQDPRALRTREQTGEAAGGTSADPHPVGHHGSHPPQTPEIQKEGSASLCRPLWAGFAGLTGGFTDERRSGRRGLKE